MDLVKGIALTLVLFSTGLLSAQDYESVSWTSNKKLSWADFRGKPQYNIRVAAVTASGISYEFSSLQRDEGVDIDYTVSTFFYPNQSWYKPELCDKLILSHEQLHFDISELFARKMRRIMEQTRFTRNVKAEVRTIYRKINKELAEFQNVYDEETNFSRNREKQLEWNQKIKEALRK